MDVIHRNSKQGMDESFIGANIEDYVKKYLSDERIDFYQECARLLGNVKGKSILDMGCGLGYMLKMLDALGASKIVGLDFCTKQLDLAKKICPKGKFYEHDIYQSLPATFDIVLCKCAPDAKRLYELIKEFCNYNKIDNIMFTGSIGYRNKTEIYKMIVEKTGWSKNKTYRTVTRP